MQSTFPAVSEPGQDWRKALNSRLGLAENVLATLEVDIDAAMRFRVGGLALTDRRLLAWAEGAWTEWPLAPGLALRCADQGGIGTLELLDAHGRLAVWRYTLAQQAAVLAFAGRF
ncbi:MAG: hypothetical protein NDI68_07290, partial [Arenimonas sp.]|nr:hypothetical protein [Arenimonas sp.]